MMKSIVNRLFGRRPPTNLRLERAMAGLAKGEDPKKRREMYQALLKGTLILSTPRAPEGADRQGWTKARTNLNIQFHSLQNARKKPAMMAFTSKETLRRWKKEESPFLALGAQDVLALARKAGMDSILINPAGPIGGELTLPEIQILAEGAIPQAVSKDGAADLEVKPGTEVRIEAPSKPPSEKLLDILRQSLARHPDVQEAFFFDVAIGGGAPHWAAGLVVQGDQKRAQEIFQTVGPEAGRYLGPGEFLDFAKLEPGPMLSEVRKAVPPFYQKVREQSGRNG